jgi:hypothetical protein
MALLVPDISRRRTLFTFAGDATPGVAASECGPNTGNQRVGNLARQRDVKTFGQGLVLLTETHRAGTKGLALAASSTRRYYR